MTLPTFVKILKTASSEVSKKTLYISRFSYIVPDLFFIFFYISLFFFSGVLDIIFICSLFLHGLKIASGVIFLVTIIFPGIFEFLLDSSINECMLDIKINKSFRFFLSILGFNAVFNASRASTELFETAGKNLAKPMICFTYPFFQIQNESFSAIKIYCLIKSGLTSLPHLFILPVLILQNGLKGTCGVTLILMNTIFFSLTIAITFPIRPTPRVFTSSFCVLLNALNKFMATMSSCGVILTIFSAAFKSIRFYALLYPFCKCITWSWPCWRTLQSQSVPLTKLSFIIYFILFTFFSSFIYIHPFEGVGKLYYYVFYFLDFLEEIIVIYMFTDMPLDSITSFFCFRVVTMGFLSSFGLVNILHKYKDEKTIYGCLSMNLTSDSTERNIHLDESQTNKEKKMQSMRSIKDLDDDSIKKESVQKSQLLS